MPFIWHPGVLLFEMMLLDIAIVQIASALYEKLRKGIF